MDDDHGDEEYDYEYEDDEDSQDDDMPAGMDSGGGASAAHEQGAGGSSSASAADDLALRDEIVAFLDQPQLKALMSKVIEDIRSVSFHFSCTGRKTVSHASSCPVPESRRWRLTRKSAWCI